MQALKRATELSVSGVRQRLQTRNYRNLPVHKNPYIESWYNAREDMEYTNVITQGMWVAGFVWAVAIPYMVYEGILAEFKTSEEVLGARKIAFYPEPVGHRHDTAETEEE